MKTEDEIIEILKEQLYGHPRHKAVEWAKEDKFDGEEYRAYRILNALKAVGVIPPPRMGGEDE